jgi:hypothetical protein
MSELGYDFEVFIHLWKDDLGNKNRGGVLDEELIRRSDSVSSLIIEEPITVEKANADVALFAPEYDMRSVVGHSTLNAMIGMFHAINILYREFNSLERSSEFSHILRLRTDISFNTSFLPEYLNDDVLISDNPLIDESIVSDHTMLLPTKSFEAIWCYDNYASFIKEYSLSDFNPELFITNRFTGSKLNIVKRWKRYVDYHVVYDPIRKHEPRLIESLAKPEDIFNLNYVGSQQRELESFYEYSKDVISGKILKYRLIKIARKMLSVFKR